jgi:hypothetical protein
VASLSAKPQYEALSYVWVDPKTKISISLRGAEREVTDNLRSALQYIRSLERQSCGLIPFAYIQPGWLFFDDTGRQGHTFFGG